MIIRKSPTNKLFKQIRHAWHFWFAVNFGVYGVVQKALYCMPHYLTGRYSAKI
ncbi:DUF3265 domain-containing protein [Vibrio vulnificus]|nr:DUF3265 domain-containing protein [Vibrio vulnificus]MCA4011110.1 DUF3265 domain-containing protein [Vibrio vulnificus]